MHKLIKHAIYILLAAILAAAIFLSMNQVYALDQIVRPYQSVRSSGMGGLRITTGLYDENFYGNPARVTANPKWKVQLPDPMVESSMDGLGSMGDLLGGSDGLNAFTDHAGENLHARVQMVFPAFYIPGEENFWAFGVISSAQVDLNLRESYQVEPDTVIDIGPALTYGRKFLDNKELSVGVTLHATYRIATGNGFSFADIISGQKSLAPSESASDGGHIDFDLGATYDLPMQWQEFSFTTALVFNNILGGFHDHIHFNLIDNPTSPTPISQPFTVGFGIVAKKKEFWTFTDFLLGLEFLDIGNSRGSFFKTLHLGTEGKIGIMAARLGINQGYISIGLGLDLTALQLDLSWYGEELTPNVGGYQDRRLALRLGFQI
jgi:hypothetical protein